MSEAVERKPTDTEAVRAIIAKVKKHTLKTIHLVLQGIWKQSAEEEEPNKER